MHALNMNEILKEVKTELLKSDSKMRAKWSQVIVANKISISELHSILKKDDTSAMRCLWLIGDIADTAPNYLLQHLHTLYCVCSKLKKVEIRASFAKFWFLCGIPEEDEVMALNILFEWLSSTESNVTTKSRALFALNRIVHKYPDLKNEFKLVTQDQMDLNSNDFKKRGQKILNEL